MHDGQDELMSARSENTHSIKYVPSGDLIYIYCVAYDSLDLRVTAQIARVS